MSRWRALREGKGVVDGSAVAPEMGPPGDGHEDEATEEGPQGDGSLGGGVPTEPMSEGAEAGAGGFHGERGCDGTVAGQGGEAHGRADEDGALPARGEAPQPGEGLDGRCQENDLPRGKPWKQGMR